jgi:hypothetical protein
MADTWSVSGGKFSLVLDGLKCGILKSCQPGSYKVEVVEIPVAAGMFPKKTIGNLGTDPCEATMGIASAAKPLWAWIQDTLDMKHSRRNGELQRGDYDGNIKSRIEFKQALFTELGLPACDGGSKESGFLTIKWTNQTQRILAGGGKLEEQEVQAAQKQWISSNFRMAIDGMNEGCKRVSKVDPITFKQETARDSVGHLREYDLIPTKSSFSDLSVTFSEVDAADWVKWYDDFIIAGKTAEDVGEKTASLEFLSPDLSKTLLTVNFENCGLLSLTVPKDEKGDAKVRSLNAKMYCERFKVQPA